MKNTHFHYFSSPINNIKLPNKFTFPFYYEPHPLCKLATKEVINYLKNQTDFNHNFGIDPSKKGLPIGKMFGVLVVENQQKEIGYITAVSGKLGETNTHLKFVPPVYDMLVKDSYYLQEKNNLIKFDGKLKKLEENTEYQKLINVYNSENEKAIIDIHQKKETLKIAKNNRRLKREKAIGELSEEAYLILKNTLSKESLEAKHFFNNVNRYWKHRLKPIKEELLVFTDEIKLLKEKHKAMSIALQVYISEQYQFLNIKKEAKNLKELFSETSVQNLPAGSGECTAPKLLQYAFLNDLKPIAMAEFWWGKSPNKEIRKHEQFYPACQGKCKPILTHMLKGIEMDTNPLLENPAIGKELETIFEDDQLIVICKPADFLSVPGIHIQDSVYTRIKQQVKNISGPIIVHRLDMATSGLLVLAKNKEAHKILQNQFITKTVQKKYTALLDGIITENSGTITLPLRVDLEDRPRQLVCYEHGKTAKTNWEVVERKNGKTKISFYPISGRTHQLRVHAAHSLGLNTPILGDDLYGKKSDRLYLHSDTLSFYHPITKEKMIFLKKAPF
ncbi:RluA family pseudouridine synthase [Tenacibaculum piscium]|uniref:RNA pseudouridine synthase n=2 Tax=Tenacibaculum piscium TaxID=1458515 RepID=A0A2H1YJU9_9FLAO|nr:RluA family pseudouridine synthase [Tenacibaculum piscium]MBE7630388.1 RNA pseudouridine synthase [Tenacibaculum piscium]MBE7671402.1 RNA pseudouridine synthase [Tenacibaculum piscium]SOS75671.1 RNA pseudouridine synthase [Tenacibaculum piscium]